MPTDHSSKDTPCTWLGARQQPAGSPSNPAQVAFDMSADVISVQKDESCPVNKHVHVRQQAVIARSCGSQL